MVYCAVNVSDTKHVIGDTKEEIISQICKWSLVGENRKLVYQFKNYKEYTGVSFGKYVDSKNDYSDSEAKQEAIKMLIREMKNAGWVLFINEANVMTTRK